MDAAFVVTESAPVSVCDGDIFVEQRVYFGEGVAQPRLEQGFRASTGRKLPVDARPQSSFADASCMDTAH